METVIRHPLLEGPTTREGVDHGVTYGPRVKYTCALGRRAVRERASRGDRVVATARLRQRQLEKVRQLARIADRCQLEMSLLRDSNYGDVVVVEQSKIR